MELESDLSQEVVFCGRVMSGVTGMRSDLRGRSGSVFAVAPAVSQAMPVSGTVSCHCPRVPDGVSLEGPNPQPQSAESYNRNPVEGDAGVLVLPEFYVAHTLVVQRYTACLIKCGMGMYCQFFRRMSLLCVSVGLSRISMFICVVVVSVGMFYFHFSSHFF